MKEILKITASLTGVCIAASIILGAVYVQTKHAREQIEEKKNEEIIKGLLGVGHGKEGASDLSVRPVYRYVINKPDGKIVLGYVVPTADSKHSLIEIDLDGKPIKTLAMAKGADLTNDAVRNIEVEKVLAKGDKATYAETFFVADKGDKRYGYVVPGVTQGFKTFIKLMISLNDNFTLTGVAITESEEDPGLGDEIKQPFFKNQFEGKTLAMMKTLEVIKKPMPPLYAKALNPEKAKKAGMTPQEVAKIKKEHVKDNIYALTGATISSRAVTRGVKNTVKKFVYRFNILTKAAEEQKLKLAF